jgi:hypothetical protein
MAAEATAAHGGARSGARTAAAIALLSVKRSTSSRRSGDPYLSLISRPHSTHALTTRAISSSDLPVAGAMAFSYCRAAFQAAGHRFDSSRVRQ